MSLRAQIPGVYWYFCTIVDPLLSLSAVYMSYFDQSTLLDPGFPRSSPNAIVTPSHAFLLHQSGGVFAAWIFLFTTMLRETKEMKVWTRFQTALAFTDVAVLYSQWKALEAQGRLDVGKLRWEESSNAVIVLVILVIRVGFVAGWGFPKGGASKRKA
jgi:hypothetical protein